MTADFFHRDGNVLLIRDSLTSSAKSTCSATSNLNESVTRIVPLATDLGIPWLLANWIPIPTGWKSFVKNFKNMHTINNLF